MSHSVRLVAHLSDVHLLDRQGTRSFKERVATRLLSYARALDPLARMLKLRRSLEAARRSGADHIVVSGDLTEVGSPGQFEVFAELLADSAIDPRRITLVPGNHDLYTSPDAWQRALDGPLRPYAESAAGAPGKIVDRGDVVFVPLDVTRFQSVMRSGGEITSSVVGSLERRLDDPGAPHAVVVLVQHHPPFGHGLGAWQWIDGLRGHARLVELLRARPDVHVLHGHMHAAVDRGIGSTVSRVFGAPAVVDDPEGSPRVRLYEVTNTRSLAPR